MNDQRASLYSTYNHLCIGKKKIKLISFISRIPLFIFSYSIYILRFWTT